MLNIFELILSLFSPKWKEILSILLYMYTYTYVCISVCVYLYKWKVSKNLLRLTSDVDKWASGKLGKTTQLFSEMELVPKNLVFQKFDSSEKNLRYVRFMLPINKNKFFGLFLQNR